MHKNAIDDINNRSMYQPNGLPKIINSIPTTSTEIIVDIDTCIKVNAKQLKNDKMSAILGISIKLPSVMDTI